MEQVLWTHAKANRDLVDIDEAHIPLATLDAPHVTPV
jgi:hypothetical protein